ncbi:MAG: hypothetical protein COA81_01120 [Alphaproteobacteria bacterium]|nr:MAG: hypothetical protein COA81_01120 [Alphaproteobacteria bacterium]
MTNGKNPQKFNFNSVPNMGRGGILHTDFWWSMLPDFEQINARLLPEILAHKAEEPETDKYSNPGCWRGYRDYESWPYIRDFVLYKLKLIHKHYIGIGASCMPLDDMPDGRVEFELWTNVNEQGSSNIIHSHSKWHWSGVYYVQGRDTGKIAFYSTPYLNQQIVKGLPFGQSYTVDPVDGLLLIFPSYLLHEVLANPIEKQRVNLAFNLRIDF